MSSFSIGIDGLDNALRSLDAWGAKVDKSSGNVMLKLAEKIKDQAIAEIDGQIKSKAGQPPAARTGTLAESIVARLVSETGSEVVTNADYAKHLELGTKKMFAHPFMKLAIALVLPQFNFAEQMAIYVAVDQLNKNAPTPSGVLGSVPTSLLRSPSSLLTNPASLLE